MGVVAMSWNHRVIREDIEVSTGKMVSSYHIREVFYDKKGKITFWSSDPRPAYGDSVEDLQRGLRMMIKACEHPMLVLKNDRLVKPDSSAAARKIKKHK